MPNLVSDPSFEIGVGWNYIGSAARRDDLGANTGSWACRLQSESFGPATSIAQQTGLLYTPGETYTVTLAVDDTNAADVPLQVIVDQGDGVLSDLGPINASAPGWRVVDLGSFVALGASGSVELRTVTGLGVWLADDVSIESPAEADEMSKLTEIRSAILTSLMGITVSNGYSADVNVLEDVLLFESVDSYPAVSVRMPRFEKERATLGRKDVAAEFPVRIFAAGDTPDTDLLDIAADVEKKLEEIATGQFLSLAYVKDVQVTSGDPGDVEEEVHLGKRLFDMTVRVDFQHDRRNA